MTYLLLIILTYLMMAANRRLLGIPGFFYYNCVRPFLKLAYRDRVNRVEEVYYWDMAEAVGEKAQWAILPSYLIAIDILPQMEWWIHAIVFGVIHYLWWVFLSFQQMKKYIPQTPALRPRTSPSRVQQA
ncbi:hypothetical protein C1X05_14225 [Laceyella sacchari]|uniref:Uncharacterized protein n=1 Tax=Laceyella tengchongensis TaxID=574699 RepID=A0AA45WQ23_9BACL|nr:hypothetical protein [Laceyella tengchongensis]AUS09863.1 hypothetical protein C1X05_14225 [Laceyella sacchari]MRG27314.1 hypothetical protein [Laceyella tengchongensis]SMP23269.1 hypothetical protein SAMN06265361_104181 [Laceyella tengchongensis]